MNDSINKFSKIPFNVCVNLYFNMIMYGVIMHDIIKVSLWWNKWSYYSVLINHLMSVEYENRKVLKLKI